MLNKKESVLLWLLSGFFFSLLVFMVVFSGLTGKALITDPQGIVETANAVLDSIQTGDWAALEGLVHENPPLTPKTGNEGSVEDLLWNHYRQSLQWTCKDGHTPQGPQVTQRITVTCLDIAAVTDTMVQMLPESAETLENREAALLAAANTVLASNPPTLQRQVTLTFVRADGQWQVLADQTLLSLLSGFTVH